MNKLLLYTWLGVLLICGLLCLGFTLGATWAVDADTIKNCQDTAGIFGSITATGGLITFFVWIMSDI